jgi:uncharacterized membrane protein YdbT with pleckstrin-like domain
MSALDTKLLAGEEIIYRTKKHWIVFFTPLIWTLGTIFLLFNSNPIIFKLAACPGLLALLTWINQILIYITSEFAITNKRVMMKEGFFVLHASELRLSTVSNMTVNQSLLGQILGYGIVVINPFGGSADVFRDILNPFEFQKRTQAELDKVVR